MFRVQHSPVPVSKRTMYADDPLPVADTWYRNGAVRSRPSLVCVTLAPVLRRLAYRLRMASPARCSAARSPRGANRSTWISRGSSHARQGDARKQRSVFSEHVVADDHVVTESQDDLGLS